MLFTLSNAVIDFGRGVVVARVFTGFNSFLDMGFEKSGFEHLQRDGKSNKKMCAVDNTIHQ